MKDSILQTAKSFLKLGVAGGVIFGIGFAFVTQNPAGDEVGPAPANADISDFMGQPSSESAKFTEAMTAMGMTPRVYDYNGNVMYFAVGTSKKKPRALMSDIQNHLVEYGVNEKNHSKIAPMKQVAQKVRWDEIQEVEDINRQFEPIQDPAEVMIHSGDVIPTEVTDHRVEMVGFERTRDGEHIGEMLEGDQSERKVANLIGGYKYIDAMWMGNETEVSAVWSGEDFSSDRMDGIGNDLSPPDPDVPVCMGCQRDYRMQTIDGLDSFSQNLYSTDITMEQAYEYYRARMKARGWHEPNSQLMLDRLAEYLPDLQKIHDQGRILHFEKDDRAMQITVMPDDSGITNVITTQESQNAQRAHPSP